MVITVAMPVVNAKASARTTAIFFMIVFLFSDAEVARTGQGPP
jgi:hypothetical protein